jgi:hypothetical protein
MPIDPKTLVNEELLAYIGAVKTTVKLGEPNPTVLYLLMDTVLLGLGFAKYADDDSWHLLMRGQMASDKRGGRSWRSPWIHLDIYDPLAWCDLQDICRRWELEMPGEDTDA